MGTWKSRYRREKPIRFDKLRNVNTDLEQQQYLEPSSVSNVNLNPIPSNAKRIVQTTSGTTTIYTVPTGKKFWLLTAGLSVAWATANTSVSAITDASGGGILAVQGNNAVNTTFSTSLTWAIPLEFTAGQVINIQSGANQTAYGSITGYEIDL